MKINSSATARQFISFKIIVLLLAIILGAASSVQAANVWDGGGGDDSWGTALNWDNDTVPTFPVALTFGGTVRLSPTNDAAGRTVNGIAFAADAGAFTIGGIAITLAGNIDSSASANPQIINLDLASTAVRTVTTAAGAPITLGGVISGTLGGINKLGAGTLTITNANNFTGQLTVGAGTLAVPTVNNSSASIAGPLGMSTLGVILGAASGGVGTLEYTGAANNATSTKKFTMATGGVGVFQVDNSVNLPISGVISGSGDLIKTGVGTLTPSGNNTYSGKTTIKNGSISASSLNYVTSGTLSTHATSAKLGMPTTVAAGTISIGDGANTGTLILTGGGETTDRVIDMAGTTGGATLDVTGATGPYVFTSDLTYSGVGAKTLTLQGSTAQNNTIQGKIADSSVSDFTSVNKLDGGTWILSGANTYSGGTTNGGGTLQAANNNALGTGPVYLSASSVRLELANGVTITNPMTMSAITSSKTNGLVAGATSATYAGSITVAGSTATRGFSLAAETGGNYTISGVISGSASGPLWKKGAGTVTLTATNTYSTSIAITNGTLALGANGKIAACPNIILSSGSTFDVSAVSGGFSLVSGQKLSGTGTNSGNFTANAGSFIIPGTEGTAGTFYFNAGLTLNGQLINFDLSSSTLTGNDQINVTGTVTNNGNTIISLRGISAGGVLQTGGTYTLITCGNTNGSGTFVLDHPYPGVTLNVSSTAVTLTIDAAGGNAYAFQWYGDVGQLWDLSAAGWTNTFTVAALSAFTNGASVLLDDTTTNSTINVSGTVSPAGINVNSTSNYMLQGSGTIAGSGPLIKSGSGSLTLLSTNAYTGGTILNAGTLALNTNSCIGTGTLVINGGTVSGNNPTITNAITINGDFSIPGNTGLTVPAFSGPVSLGTASGTSRTITETAANSGTGQPAFTGVISDGVTAKKLIKAGTGGLSLSGTSTFSGGVDLNAGVLIANSSGALGTGDLTIAGGTTLSVAGVTVKTVPNHVVVNGDFTLGLNGKAVLTLSGDVDFAGGSRTITIGNVDGDVISGAITNGGTLTLSMFSTNLMTLSGLNTFTGGVNVTGGTLLVDNNSALGSGTLTLADSTTVSVAGAIPRTLNNHVVANGNITLGVGGKTNLTLTGDMDLTGGARTITPAVTNGAMITINGAITNGVNLTVTHGTGVAPITFGGNNTFTGSLTILNASHLYVSSDANFGSVTNVIISQNATLHTTASFAMNASKTLWFSGGAPALDVAPGTTLTVNGLVNLVGTSATSFLPSKNTGTGTLTLNGNGWVVPAGNTNVFSVAAGTVNFGNVHALDNLPYLRVSSVSLDNTSGSDFTAATGLQVAASPTFIGNTNMGFSGLSAIMNNDRTITVNSNTLTLSGGVTNDGTAHALTKAGAGTLLLSGANTYGGATTVSAGTLLVNGLTSTNVIVATNATFGGSGTIGGTVNFNSGSHAAFTNGAPLTIGGDLILATSGTIPDVKLALSNNVPVGNYTLATYAGSLTGAFNAIPATPLLSGSFALGTTNYITTGGGNVVLHVASAGGGGAVVTTTTLGTSGSPSTYGDSVTFTATVQTNSPTGTAITATSNYVFKVDGTAVATNAVSGGQATYSTTNLIAGVHSIAAEYAGDANYQASTNTVSQSVNPKGLTITANNTNLVYTGVAFSGGNGVSYAGFVNGETNTALGGVLSYSGTSQGAIAVGSYVITPSGLTNLVNTNYTIGFANGTLTINHLSTTTNVTSSVTGNTLTLTWPDSHLGWMAQSNAVDLANPGDWYDITSSTNGTSLSIPMDAAQTNVFYRLRLP